MLYLLLSSNLPKQGFNHFSKAANSSTWFIETTTESLEKRDVTVSNAIAITVAIALPLVSVGLIIILLRRWKKTRAYNEMT